MALAFGARESTGLIVPLLLVGDIFAVIYYQTFKQLFTVIIVVGEIWSQFNIDSVELYAV